MVITLITQRTSACNTSYGKIKNVLANDNGTVDASLVCSGVATEDEICSPDSIC